MNSIVKYNLILLALCSSLSQALAQTAVRNELTIKGTPFGMYLELGSVPPSGVGFTVYRKDGDNREFLQIGGFLPPVSLADFHFRLNSYARLLGNYTPFRDQLAAQLWAMYQGKARDSLTMGEALPPLYLATGIAFADTTAQQGSEYTYRLQFADGRQFESPKVAASAQQVRFAPMVSHTSDAGYSRIALEWKTSQQGAAPYWEVWRKQQGSNSFINVMPEKGVRKLPDADSLVFLVLDSAVYSGVTYDYYLEAKDALGNAGTHSDTIRIEVGGRKNVPAIYGLNTTADSAGIRLTWSIPPGSATLRSILLLRSNRYDNGYETLAMLPATDSSYVDRNVTGGTNYYYQLIAEGDANFSMPTARVSGMFYLENPAILEPVFAIRAVGMDKHIALSWYYENRNIAGFRIFRAMARDGAYTQVGDLLDVSTATDTSAYVFTDSTLLAAHTSYYYSVVPVSKTYANGPVSEHVAAMPRGVAAVTIPSAIRGIFMADTVISISWKDLQSAEPGIAGYRIYRKGVADGGFSDADQLAEARLNEFVDTLKAGQQAWYALRTLAVNGDLSDYSEAVSFTARIDKPVPPGSFRAYVQDEEILLTWDGNTGGNISKYHIYRATGKEPVQEVTTVAAGAEEMSYSDKSVKKGVRYYYYLTAEHKSGLESNKTQEIIAGPE